MRIVSMLLYLICAPFIGGLLEGVDRKISARMQGRVGPPVLQPFYDVGKLFAKENISVDDVQEILVFCNLVFLVITGCLFFYGKDMLLSMFTLTLAEVFLVVAAFSTGSPYSEVGAKRELLQMMAYEPVVLMVPIGFYTVSESFNVADIVSSGTPYILYLPGFFLAFVYILAIKFRKSPFDLSLSHHAHQELAKGLSTEFSGRTLAFMEISEWYETVLLYGFVFLFFGWLPLLALLMCAVVYFLEILIDNVCARTKWQMALESTWLVAVPFAIVNLLVLFLMK